jgi:mannose/fructose/N-acetylgalactosamine-specific phosphotransferase system component IIC
VQDNLRLRNLSAMLYWGALGLSVLVPLVVLVYAGKAVTDPGTLLSQVPSVPAGSPVTTVQAGLVAAVALVSVLPLVASLRGTVRLFGAYRDGEILSAANADRVLRIGRNLVLVAVFSVLVPTLQTLILSWNAAQKVLSIGIDGGTLGFLMAAGLLTVIGYAMREAALVKAENEGFV